jgi:hypothetical protein
LGGNAVGQTCPRCDGESSKVGERANDEARGCCPRANCVGIGKDRCDFRRS